MRRHLHFAAVVFFLTFQVPLLAAPPSPARVDEAILRAKKWLYEHQKDGTWEIASKRKADAGWQYDCGQWGGVTALTTYALLAAGDNPQQEERLEKAITFLKSADIIGTYALGCRSMVWLTMPQTPETKTLIRKDVKLLLEMVKTLPGARGFYDYVKSPQSAEYSCSRSQYGVLGVWAAAQAGVEIPDTYWKMVEEAWVKAQSPDGGWGYTAGSKTPANTAAGIATLLLIGDYTNPQQGVKCTGNLTNPAIERGLVSMAKQMDGIAPKVRYGADFAFTTLYTFERMGLSSGRKYIGGVDWYEKGANWLLDRQDKDGSWSEHDGGYNGGADMGGPIATSLAILFLSRGQAPVAISKLEYENVASGAKMPAWNQRPRDAANVARWIGKTAEKWLNWQSVELKSASVLDLHDAPILYMSGSGNMQLTDENIKKLKEYIETGGLILGNADCGDRNFAESFRKLGEKMFPADKWRQLPANHALFASQVFIAKGNAPIQLLGLSNGVRELMILPVATDLGRAWQQRDSAAAAGKASFEFGANLFSYATSKNFGSRRSESHLVASDPAIKTNQTIKLARLKYDGNWDPEPGGWRRLASVLHNSDQVELTATPVMLGKDALDGYVVAHLTGTDAIKLDDASRKALKAFVDGGGTLIVDAAGGASAFAQSAESELNAIWPAESKGLQSPLPPNHVAFGGKESRLPSPLFRPFTRAQLGRLTAPRVRAIEIKSRPAVFFSAEDLSAGLVGEPVDGIMGYNPDAATELMARIVLFAARLPVTKAASQPTTNPS